MAQGIIDNEIDRPTLVIEYGSGLEVVFVNTTFPQVSKSAGDCASRS